MDYLNSTDTRNLHTPELVALNDTGKIRVMLYGTGAVLAGLSLWVIDPSGSAVDITSYLKAITVPFTFLTLFEMSYTFSQKGKYTFALHDSVSGDIFTEGTDTAEWAERLDIPVSDILKLRSELQRIFSQRR